METPCKTENDQLVSVLLGVSVQNGLHFLIGILSRIISRLPGSLITPHVILRLGTTEQAPAEQAPAEQAPAEQAPAERAKKNQSFPYLNCTRSLRIHGGASARTQEIGRKVG